MTAKKTKAAKKECIYPGCSGEQATRGLCRKHYAVAKRLIKQGKVTEEDLISRGLLLPSSRDLQKVDSEAFLSSDVRGDAG